MEIGEEIISENDDQLMSDSMQLQHPCEALLTTQATNIAEEIEVHPATNVEEEREIPLSLPESNNNPGGDSTLYYSRSSTDNSASLSRASIIFDMIEHADDWGAISDRSGPLRKKTNNENYEKTNKGSTEMAYIYPRPEKELINFALRIVIMEKTACGVGLLTFIWATVVLLGGFASALKMIDFVFITTIIFMVGTGIFNRNHQLDSRFFFRAAKAISSTIGRNLTILQFSFASICITFSMMRLIECIYSKNHPYTTNMEFALYIFYAMALVHAMLFLLKNAYWFWRVSYHKIIHELSGEFGFGVSGVLLVQRFFYETYWQISKGSVFSALDLDIITFAQGLLVSNSRKDQLIAVRILNGTINHEKYSEEARRMLETSTESVGKLFKMLTWKYQEDATIRIIAARIVDRLASSLLVEDIPGGMDCIHSLLTVPITPEDSKAKNLELNLLGLNILLNLADKPKNCWKIRETRGLLLMVVEFTKCKNDVIPNNSDLLKIVKRSLMLLKKIISTDGRTGSIRRAISEIDFTMSNLRVILLCEQNPKLVTVAVETLTALSVDLHARKKIGKTSGIIKVLLSMFFQLSHSSCEYELRLKAGGLLEILVLQSKRNCSEVLDLEDVVEKLVEIISGKILVNSGLVDIKHLKRRISIRRLKLIYKITAMKILRNLVAFAGRRWHDRLKVVIDALPPVLRTIMSLKSDNKLLEASTGLFVQIRKFSSIEEFTEIIRNTGFTITDVTGMLLTVLRTNHAPNIEFPCIRRYAIELAIWMMKSNIAPSISDFKRGELKNELTKVAETTSDTENFQLFSNYVGVAKHPQSISSLVLKAKRLLE